MPLTDVEIAQLKELLNKMTTAKYTTDPITQSDAIIQSMAKPKDTVDTTKAQSETNATEPLSIKKFSYGMLNPANTVLWAKDVASIFNVRKLIIYAVVILGFVGWGYYKGLKNKPLIVQPMTHEVVIQVAKDLQLHILPNGTMHTQDNNGITIHQITIGDVPGLTSLLKPIGFQLKPIGVMGLGVGGKGIGAEGGLGISWFRFYYWRLQSFITNKGLYPIGVAYHLDSLRMPNSMIGIAGGVGFDKSTRVMLYYSWNF